MMGRTQEEEAVIAMTEIIDNALTIELEQHQNDDTSTAQIY